MDSVGDLREALRILFSALPRRRRRQGLLTLILMLVGAGAEMLGISADLSFAQTAFKNSVAPKGPDGKPLPLEALSFVSDRTLSIAQKYDAANPNNAKRYYFLIDDKGKILWRSVNNSLIPTDKLITDLGAVLKTSSN